MNNEQKERLLELIEGTDFEKFFKEAIRTADNSAWQGWVIPIYYTPSTEKFDDGSPRSNGYAIFSDDTEEICSIDCRCIGQDYSCQIENEDDLDDDELEELKDEWYDDEIDKHFDWEIEQLKQRIEENYPNDED